MRLLFAVLVLCCCVAERRELNKSFNYFSNRLHAVEQSMQVR